MLNNLKKIHAFQSWDNFLGTLKFFRYNPHSIPGLSDLMCKLGRHDYQVSSVNRRARLVMLECFYCLHRKQTAPMNKWPK